MESHLDFGPFLGELVQEFDCDAPALEYISVMLESNFDLPNEDSSQQIERFYRKVSKKRPALAAQLSRLVSGIVNSELCNANELIAFFIFFANARAGMRREQRKARLAVLNEAPSSMSDSAKSTPKHYALSPSTFTIKTDVSRVRFLDMDVKKTPILNGRALGQSVVDKDIIMGEILSALVGIEGRYIVLIEQDLFGVSEHCAIDDVLYSQLLNILRICSSYKTLQRVTLNSSHDLMIQAFYGCIPDILTEYSEIVSSQYSRFAHCSLNLSPLDVSVELDEWQLVLQQFVFISKKCSEKCSGMEIVRLIYGLYCRCASDSLAKRILKVALRAMLGLFHRCMLQWLLYGTLIENVEWMIAVQSDRSSNNPWSKKYEIVNDTIPEIFKNIPKLVKKILMIGRSVALLNSLNVKDHYFAERKRLIESLNSVDIYLYVEEAIKFSVVINRIYKRMNTEVMVEVVGNYLIRDHLDIVQRHFFLTDECFALSFFQQLSDVANDNLICLDSKRACFAFTEAVSECSSFPMKLKEHGHLEATCGIMENDGKIFPSPRDENGYPTVRLRYITKVPVSIVLNERALDRYNGIFEFVWQILSTDFRLSEVMQTHGNLYADVLPKWKEMVKFCRLFSAVFVRMAYYMSILRIFVNAVVEHCSKKFASQFDSPSCGDLVKLVGSHRFFLSSVEEQLFLDEDGKTVRTAILATLGAIHDGISEYGKFQQQLRLLLNSAPAEFFDAGDPMFGEVDETKAFEFEEKRVELRAEFDILLNTYKPLVRNVHARFELLVSDVASGLTGIDKTTASLLLQHLRFGNFY